MKQDREYSYRTKLGRSLRTAPEKRLVQLPRDPFQKKELPICVQIHAQGYVAQRDRIRGNVEND